MTRYQIVLVASCMVPLAAAIAAAPVVITQIDRHFSVGQVSIQRGQTIRFTNNDEFSHHVYVKSAQFNFDSGERKPGQSVDVAFDTRGQFDVRCEIHPKMLLKVTVN